MGPPADDFDNFFNDDPCNSPHDSGWELCPLDRMDTNLDHVFNLADMRDIDHDPVPEEEQAQQAIDIGQVPRYQFRSCNLRPGAKDDGKFVWITWLDTDDSGTYDPTTSERRQRRRHKPSTTRPQQQTRKQRPSENSDDDETTIDEQEPMAARLSRLAAVQQGVSITVTLDLTTMALQSLASRIPDHWPGDEYNTLSDEHYLFLANQINNNADKWQPYNFRRRAVAPTKEEQTTSELVLPEGRIPDPLGEELDLRHHPAARGCKACRELDNDKDCSLLRDEFSWPCLACLEDDVDCELITPPTRKAACHQCQRRRQPCSYQTHDSDPTKPCTDCAKVNKDCVAAPAPSAIRERIRIEHDYSQPRPGRTDDRMYVTCAACRRKKKRCSLQSKVDAPPCLSCKQDEIECTFERLPPRHRKRRSNNERKPSSSEDDLTSRAQHGTQPEPQTIRTALNHPVFFLHDEPEECNWCTENIGVIGRGVRDKVVIPSPDGLSYTEISEDQNSNNETGERMCATCTLQRCHIIGCTQHELRHLNAEDVKNIDLHGMYRRILQGKRNSKDVWCSLCPSPALFSCCRLQTSDFWGESTNAPTSKAAVGCGLLLCEECAVCLGQVGSLEKVIDAIQDKATSLENWPLGGRADLDFLRQSGLLVRNVMADMDEDPQAAAMDLET